MAHIRARLAGMGFDWRAPTIATLAPTVAAVALMGGKALWPRFIETGSDTCDDDPVFEDQSCSVPKVNVYETAALKASAVGNHMPAHDQLIEINTALPHHPNPEPSDTPESSYDTVTKNAMQVISLISIIWSMIVVLYQIMTFFKSHQQSDHAKARKVQEDNLSINVAHLSESMAFMVARITDVKDAAEESRQKSGEEVEKLTHSNARLTSELAAAVDAIKHLIQDHKNGIEQMQTQVAAAHQEILALKISQRHDIEAVRTLARQTHDGHSNHEKDTNSLRESWANHIKASKEQQDQIQAQRIQSESLQQKLKSIETENMGLKKATKDIEAEIAQAREQSSAREAETLKLQDNVGVLENEKSSLEEGLKERDAETTRAWVEADAAKRQAKQLQDELIAATRSKITALQNAKELKAVCVCKAWQGEAQQQGSTQNEQGWCQDQQGGDHEDETPNDNEQSVVVCQDGHEDGQQGTMGAEGDGYGGQDNTAGEAGQEAAMPATADELDGPDHRERVYAQMTEDEMLDAWSKACEVLDVDADHTKQDVKRARNKLSLVWHSDHNPNKEMAKEKMAEINEAHDTLVYWLRLEGKA